MTAALRITILLVCLLASCLAFSPSFRPSALLATSKVVRSTQLYAKKKEVAPLLDKNGKEFWQGDWVCAGELWEKSFYFSFCRP